MSLVAVPVDGAAETFFGQVATAAPATTFTPSQGGGLPRDLGNVFGPEGLGIVSPEITAGATDVVTGVYRAVTGTPATIATPQPQGVLSSTTLIVILVVAGIGFLLWKS